MAHGYTDTLSFSLGHCIVIVCPPTYGFWFYPLIFFLIFYITGGSVRVMVFSATFYNVSVIVWRFYIINQMFIFQEKVLAFGIHFYINVWPTHVRTVT
jgi:hypothetical protein